jgi:hypothetical protein
MTVGGLTVEFVPSVGQIDAALWETCFPPPIEGRWWYETLESSGLEAQFSFLYGVIHRDGAPVGIAPAFLMNFPVSLVAPSWLEPVIRWLDRFVPTLARPRTLFVGSPCADQGTVGLLADVDKRAALLALHRALQVEARKLDAALLVWKDFAQPDAADLEWLAQNAGLFRLVSFPGTIIDFPGPDKDSYFAGLKHSHRYNLRRNLRRSQSKIELLTEILHDPDERALDELFGLFRQTYERAKTRFEELNRQFFATIAKHSCAQFIVLRERARNEMVAFMLCFDLGAKVINKFVGFDYRQPREWLLYFRLWDAAVDWALARGATSIQSGQTGYAPKIEIGHRLVPLFNYCSHRNPIVHALAAACARHISWSTLDEDLARRVEGTHSQRWRS